MKLSHIISETFVGVNEKETEQNTMDSKKIKCETESSDDSSTPKR